MSEESKKCECHYLDWWDEMRKNGRVRTVCSVCGRFIGYRPVDDPKRKRERKT